MTWTVGTDKRFRAEGKLSSEGQWVPYVRQRFPNEKNAITAAGHGRVRKEGGVEDCPRPSSFSQNSP